MPVMDGPPGPSGAPMDVGPSGQGSSSMLNPKTLLIIGGGLLAAILAYRWYSSNSAGTAATSTTTDPSQASTGTSNPPVFNITIQEPAAPVNTTTHTPITKTPVLPKPKPKVPPKAKTVVKTNPVSHTTGKVYASAAKATPSNAAHQGAINKVANIKGGKGGPDDYAINKNITSTDIVGTHSGSIAPSSAPTPQAYSIRSV